MAMHRYRVEQDGVFLGHHHGNSLQSVVQKAIDQYGRFHHIDEHKPFLLTKGSKIYQVFYENPGSDK